MAWGSSNLHVPRFLFKSWTISANFGFSNRCFLNCVNEGSCNGVWSLSLSSRVSSSVDRSWVGQRDGMAYNGGKWKAFLMLHLPAWELHVLPTWGRNRENLLSTEFLIPPGRYGNELSSMMLSNDRETLDRISGSDCVPSPWSSLANWGCAFWRAFIWRGGDNPTLFKMLLQEVDAAMYRGGSGGGLGEGGGTRYLLLVWVVVVVVAAGYMLNVLAGFSINWVGCLKSLMERLAGDGGLGDGEDPLMPGTLFSKRVPEEWSYFFTFVSIFTLWITVLEATCQHTHHEAPSM
jgi:hypothetical protein